MRRIPRPFLHLDMMVAGFDSINTSSPLQRHLSKKISELVDEGIEVTRWDEHVYLRHGLWDSTYITFWKKSSIVNWHSENLGALAAVIDMIN